METLRIHVERIVRPIRASVRRKNKMREELLAHLEQRANEAMTNGAPERDACMLAANQLGDPVALRAELQSTVPGFEQTLFVTLAPLAGENRLNERAEGESIPCFAGRMAAYISMLAALAIGAVGAIDAIAMATGQHAWDSVWEIKLGLMLLIVIGCITAATFIAYWAAGASGILPRLSNKAAVSVFARTVSLYIFATGYLATFMVIAIPVFYVSIPALLGIEVSSLSPTVLVPIALPALFILLIQSLLVAWSMQKERAQYEKWGKLKIDE